MIKISPSILTADFTRLGDALRRLEEAGADMLHIDVMDGVFVPNISVGFPVCESMYNNTELPLDIHLMIIRPQEYIGRFAKYAERITIHYESDCDVRDTLRKIRALGVKPALSVKPATPVEEIFDLLDEVDMVLIMTVEPGFGGQSYIDSTTEKITALRRECDRRGLDTDIEVDGGINFTTVRTVAKAGANVIVAGSTVFNADDMTAAVNQLREAACSVL